MREIFALLLTIAIQTLFIGLLGGLALKPLAARIAKIDIPMSRAWSVEFGAAFFSLSLVAIITMLTALHDASIWMKMMVGFPVTLACRSFVYTQFIEKEEGRAIDGIDAFTLAAALAAIALAVGVLFIILGVALVAVFPK
jgi:hypothetical protein